MTGEMHRINQDGIDSNGEKWGYHASLAKRIGGTLKPFDSYQGPYIVVGADPCAGSSPYRMPIRGLGIVRLWLMDDDGFCKVYREDTDKCAEPVPYDDDLIETAARELLTA